MKTGRVAPPQRTAFIAGLNRVLGLAEFTGALAPARFSKEILQEAAIRKAGSGGAERFDDFGDPWYERPFDALLEAVGGEARLNLAGRHSASQQFIKVLTDRLWAQMWFKRYPEILERPIPRPVVIVGPMRSGTTRLHRLLASDQRFSHMRSFETISPVPRPGFEDVLAGKAKDFRPVLASRVMKVARVANPRTLSIHPTGPYEPEEELGLLVASMWGMKHDAQWQVPSYSAWCAGVDAEPAYRHLANLLRLIGWSQQSSPMRPWILKTPQHMLDLPALLKVFPDARLIFTHRDPRNIVGSAASLAWNQTIIYSDHVQPARIGTDWLSKTEQQISRMRSARAGLAPERAIDVQYEDMERDWHPEMERIYRFLDLDMTPAEPKMADYLERSKALKRHPHVYRLSDFGLEADEVLERFSDYVSAFDVPTEGWGGGSSTSTAATQIREERRRRYG